MSRPTHKPFFVILVIRPPQEECDFYAPEEGADIADDESNPETASGENFSEASLSEIETPQPAEVTGEKSLPVYEACQSDLSYYKARYYHPALGRFLQRDPLGYVDGYNLYAYTQNNPINWIDPLGLKGVAQLNKRDASNPFALKLEKPISEDVLKGLQDQTGRLRWEHNEVGQDSWEIPWTGTGQNGVTQLRILKPGDKGYQYMTTNGYRVNMPEGHTTSVNELGSGIWPGRPTVTVTGGRNQIFIVDSTPAWIGDAFRGVAVAGTVAGGGITTAAYGPTLMSSAYSGYATAMTLAATPQGQNFLKNTTEFLSNAIEGADATPPSSTWGYYGFVANKISDWLKPYVKK